jgi:GTP-binding protein Era
MKHKETAYHSGFVALAGRPNVGKSTLMNALLGEKIAITSAKPQTTRNRQCGILTGADFQIIWVDTPGLHRPLHELGEQMVGIARQALAGVDFILWLLDAEQGFTTADAKVAGILGGVNRPVLAVWNKMDLAPAQPGLPDLPFLRAVLTVSALTGAGVPELLAAVRNELPEGPAFYPEDQLSDQPERFIVAELIREQVLHQTSDEVPHAVAVKVEEMQERPGGKTYIKATTFVERESQKGIIIGAGGARLKEIGVAARESIQNVLGIDVYLDLWVKVRSKWRKNPASLKEFGYWAEKPRR